MLAAISVRNHAVCRGSHSAELPRHSFRDKLQIVSSTARMDFPFPTWNTTSSIPGLSAAGCWQ